jgi:HK97 family phage major capsid protein
MEGHMPHALVEGYIHERDQLLNTIAVFKDTATAQDRDPNENELEAMTKAFERIDKLDKLIEVVGQDREMDAEMRDRLMNNTPPAPAPVKYRTGGELVWDCLHATYGSSHDVGDQEAKRRWELVMKRAAQHMGTAAAATTPVAGDLAGLYVVPVVGPVIDLSPSGQPFLSAIGRRPAPNAMTFTRPRLVDPDLATGAAKQSAEKAELVSKKFDVKVDNLTLETVGGYLNVSQQLMSLQAGAWDIIVNQLSKRVAYAGEAAAIAEAGQTGAHVALPAATTDPAVVLAALYDGASLVYENTNALPTWIAYGAQGWAMLGKLTDAAGRPLYPFLGASNAFGSGDLGSFSGGPLGLQQIVTHGITDTNIYMGNSAGLEAYVYSFPILEAPEPSVMGRQVAVAEAMALYRPTTAEAGPSNTPPAKADGIVRIGP